MTCRFNDKDPEYRFGIEGAWLLAPTRHGAHNWEGGTAAEFCGRELSEKLGVHFFRYSNLYNVRPPSYKLVYKPQ